MKLDRNLPDNEGRGKYAILKLRSLEDYHIPADVGGPFAGYGPEINQALEILDKKGLIDWGEAGTDREFFLIRLKDKYAQPALYAYAEAANEDGDSEFANEVVDMAMRSGISSPWCKKPD